MKIKDLPHCSGNMNKRWAMKLAEERGQCQAYSSPLSSWGSLWIVLLASAGWLENLPSFLRWDFLGLFTQGKGEDGRTKRISKYEATNQPASSPHPRPPPETASLSFQSNIFRESIALPYIITCWLYFKAFMVKQLQLQTAALPVTRVRCAQLHGPQGTTLALLGILFKHLFSDLTHMWNLMNKLN